MPLFFVCVVALEQEGGEITMCSSYLVRLLMGFRNQVEVDASQPLADLELNAGLLLFDLCKAAGLSEIEIDMVLGPAGGAVRSLLSESVSAVWIGAKEPELEPV